MKTRFMQASAIALSLLTVAPHLNAQGNGISGGLTLLEAPGARASALGEAFTATVDDVAAFSYNPALLRSLKTGQASFLHQKGILDDAYSQFMIGSPWRSNMGVGLSIGYYNGGDFEMSDGVSSRNVTAQRDLLVAMGLARSYGNVSLGFTGKYLSSELAETESATALAIDLGLGYAVSPRFNVGGSLQNYGTKLRYASEGDDLPRIFRLGASYAILPHYGTVLMFDVQRLMNEGETRPSIGVETRVGPMALRAGYKHGSAREFSMGTGFAWGKSSLDYAFGLMSSELDSKHRISYSFRFGSAGAGDAFASNRIGGVAAPAAVARPIVPAKTRIVTPADPGRAKMEAKLRSSEPAVRAPLAPVTPRVTKAKRMYVIKSGDTLAKIAKEVYGDHRMWRTIYLANRHLLTSPTDVEVGQKIALP